MCDVLHIESSSACFIISHRDAIATPTIGYGDDIDSPHNRKICMCMYNSSLKLCGVAFGLDPDYARVTEKDSYICVLVSCSLKTATAMGDRERFPKQPKPVRISSRTDALKYMQLPETTDEWPKSVAQTGLTDFEDRDWAYLNVLILKPVGSTRLYERVGSGQVHEDAWNREGPQSGTFKII